MLLTVDIGNTNLTIGLYQGETLVHHWRLATEQTRMPDEYGLQLLGLLTNAGRTLADLTGVCLASVVPPLTGRIVLPAWMRAIDAPSLWPRRKGRSIARLSRRSGRATSASSCM